MYGKIKFCDMVRFKGGNGFVITDICTSAVKSINHIPKKKFVFA